MIPYITSIFFDVLPVSYSIPKEFHKRRTFSLIRNCHNGNKVFIESTDNEDYSILELRSIPQF